MTPDRFTFHAKDGVLFRSSWVGTIATDLALGERLAELWRGSDEPAANELRQALAEIQQYQTAQGIAA